MKPMTRTLPAGLLAALAVAGAASAGAAADPDENEKSARAEAVAKPITPLTLDVVFTRFQGDKKVASAPYSFPLNANERRTAKVRMGINVPLRYEGKDSPPGNVVYKSVGNNIDCSAESLDGGRFKVMCFLEQSSVYPDAPPSGGRSEVPPLLRTFNTETLLFLRDGQTAQGAMATDPVSGEVLKVDITLHVVK